MFNTGSAPGSPRQTGHTFVLGAAPKPVGHAQKIFVRSPVGTCTSRPITASYLAIAVAEDMFYYRVGSRWLSSSRTGFHSRVSRCAAASFEELSFCATRSRCASQELSPAAAHRLNHLYACM